MAMTISRKDVECEKITQFSAAERFIKLPIENYLRELALANKEEDQTNKPQIALINAINNPKYRFVCAALSRRLGKTYIANIIAQLVALVPNCHVLIMSPNYSLSTISFELQRKLVNKFGLEIQRDNLKDRILELANGSSVRMGSVGQVDSCVGRSYDLILFDEAALDSRGEDAFNVALRPTLDKPNSKAIFISTPRGKKNWFTKFWHRGFSDDRELSEWVSIHADYKENHRMTEKDVRSARATMTKAEFEQEYMASFTTYEGQIYDFAAHNIIDYIPDLDTLEIFAGLDPGYRDHTAFIVVGYCDSDRTYYILDEYLEKEKVTSEHAASFKTLIDKYSIENIFIDAAAAQFSADLAYQYDIPSTKGKKNVLEGIAFLQNIVEGDRLKVHKNCTNTLDSLDSYQWDQSDTLTKDRPLHGLASHMADAMRYAIYTFTT